MLVVSSTDIACGYRVSSGGRGLKLTASILNLPEGYVPKQIHKVEFHAYGYRTTSNTSLGQSSTLMLATTSSVSVSLTTFGSAAPKRAAPPRPSSPKLMPPRLSLPSYPPSTSRLGHLAAVIVALSFTARPTSRPSSISLLVSLCRRAGTRTTTGASTMMTNCRSIVNLKMDIFTHSPGKIAASTLVYCR